MKTSVQVKPPSPPPPKKPESPWFLSPMSDCKGRLLPVATAAFGGFLPILDGGDDQQRSNSVGLPFRVRL